MEMDILQRIEIKIDALLKCWAVTQGDKERTLFEVVDELIKQQESKEDKVKTLEERYEESHNQENYLDILSQVVNDYFAAGQKPPVDSRGYFIDKDRVFNIKDIK